LSEVLGRCRLPWFFKNTLYFNPKKSHWGGKIMLLKLLGMLNCLTTFIDTTANGVDLINIANPNSVGVSVNHYNKFNVGNQGAILNNDCPLTIVSLEVLIKLQPLQSKPHYNKFNVGNQGAILNNSKVMGTSQLGGAVYGNPNLNQNADIILNEVGSTNRSWYLQLDWRRTHYLRHLIQKRLGG
jgi:filamentous hemagglutinin family protein